MEPGVVGRSVSPPTDVGIQYSQSESFAEAGGKIVFVYDLAAYRLATSDAALAFRLASSTSLAASVDNDDISAKAESKVRMRSAAADSDDGLLAGVFVSTVNGTWAVFVIFITCDGGSGGGGGGGGGPRGTVVLEVMIG